VRAGRSFPVSNTTNAVRWARIRLIADMPDIVSGLPSPRMARLRVLLVTGALALTAAPAAAQDPGVTYDDDSPAGTEYAIPLEQARREAAGTGVGTPAPAFGEGIQPQATTTGARHASGEPAASSPSAAGSGRQSESSSNGRSGRSSATGTARATATPSQAARIADVRLDSSLSATGSGGTSKGLLIAGGAAVLALLAGFGVRGLRHRLSA
jgi:hypothetical protein